MCSNRQFQAGCKIWAVLSALLIATLLTLEFDPSISNLYGKKVNLVSGYVAAVLSMSERTEATASKVCWLVGLVWFGLICSVGQLAACS
jgi:hypothetical protein